MFNGVLIANRGEIACRIMRTLRRLGIRAVAVHHFEDRHAPHCEMADAVVELEAEVATAAYLDGSQIVAAAKAQDCEAIHPGYGFLAENAQFAAAVRDAGLVFVGPPAEVISLMGDKLESRLVAERAGIPLAPSIAQTGDLDDFLTGAADTIGFPLLIKAAAGGGGKGMHIVRSAAELPEQARIAAAEAERYFSDGRIYAERYIERPRHIEVQILADRAGNVVHLFERECSIQRRFQKMIEETPAPNLSADLRDRICAAAVELARAAHYENAGTVEFILDADGAYYFLEMNTRLQVEHPVTEAVVGIDLVEAQLSIAAGKELGLAQADLTRTGHAIECRVCAEEPARDFAPATGTVRLQHLPSGPGVRIDNGVKTGQRVTASFDSMLAKLIVHGTDRPAAISACIEALEHYIVLGVNTNVDYLRRIISHRAFQAGYTHTGFIDEFRAELEPARLTEQSRDALLLAAAGATHEFRRLVADVPEPHRSIGAWRN